MKKLLLFGMFLLSATGMLAQEKGTTSLEKQRRFHVGFSYGFGRTWFKLKSYEAHSVWQGADLGTLVLDGEEIAAVNEARTDVNNLNALLVQAGYVILNKPDRSWFLDFNLSVGVAAARTTTNLDVPVENSLKVKSGLSNPMLGVMFNFRYKFTDHWGVSLVPEADYMWGRSTNIADSIHPMVSNFLNELTEDYIQAYTRVTLLASYTIKRLTVSAGPGFYYAYQKKTYSMQRTDPNTGSHYSDEIKTTLCSRSFIDGCFRADWVVIDPLTFTLQAAFGKDIFLNTGIRFNF